jgi:acetyl-CoA decarbonylase/synthase complex subunit gamma
MIALVDESQSPDGMVSAVETIYNELGVPMVLVSPKSENLSAAAMGPLSGARPLLYCAATVTVDELVGLAKQTGCPICLAGDLQTVADGVDALSAQGVKDVVISPGPTGPAQTLAFLTKTRRAALSKKFRPLGCPVLTIACGQDKAAAALDACAYVCKYAGVVVSDAWEPHLLAAILTTRQNIYTDPQKPVQVEAKLYEIGEVTPASPVLVTTNFSLSYYSVESEVEASRIPCRILAIDTEGTSVLTSWAADKFNAQTITAGLKASGLESKAPHRQLVIPGHVAVIAASLAEESGWKVLVGPKEASGIGAFLKNDWKVA